MPNLSSNPKACHNTKPKKYRKALRATLAPPIESLTVGREALVNSRLTFGRRDTSFCFSCCG